MQRLALLVVCTVLTTALLAEQPHRKKDQADALLTEALDVFQRHHHGRRLTRRQLAEAAIEGMTLRVDPDGAFYNTDDLATLRSGFIVPGDVGLDIHVERRIVVTNIQSNSSAATAGVQRGDVILEIDGIAAQNLSVHEAAHRLRGRNGKTVSVRIIGQADVDSRHVELTCDQPHRPPHVFPRPFHSNAVTIF